jgi:hypothetical protein
VSFAPRGYRSFSLYCPDGRIEEEKCFWHISADLAGILWGFVDAVLSKKTRQKNTPPPVKEARLGGYNMNAYYTLLQFVVID